MKVLVIGLNGIGLMPTTPRKARLLIEAGKAVVVRKSPFTIRLNYKTGAAVQKVSLGIDTGEQHIGAAVVSGDKVLVQDEIILRKSMEKRKLMEKRTSYRKGRRYRNTPYRHPKFRFHTKRICTYDAKKGRYCWVKQKNLVMTSRKEGWLPPSIESKVEHHKKWISWYLEALPKGTRVVIEVAKFDMAKMKDPEICGEAYQQGNLYAFENLKSYVLAKYDYKCPVCGLKFNKDRRPRLHHISFRKNGATDNPDEFAPVCSACHTAQAHQPGGALDMLRKKTKRKEYREPVFMNILRKRLFKAFPEAEFTYGNITTVDRKRLGLEKSHVFDAAAIAMKNSGVEKVKTLDHATVYIQQRKKKRSLHEANPRKGRIKPNTGAVRNSKNTKSVYVKGKVFQLLDRVQLQDGRKGYISGFSGSNVYVKTLDGEYLQRENGNKLYPLSRVKKISSTNNWISGIRNEA